MAPSYCTCEYVNRNVLHHVSAEFRSEVYHVEVRWLIRRDATHEHTSQNACDRAVTCNCQRHIALPLRVLIQHSLEQHVVLAAGGLAALATYRFLEDHEPEYVENSLLKPEPGPFARKTTADLLFTAVSVAAGDGIVIC